MSRYLEEIAHRCKRSAWNQSQYGILQYPGCTYPLISCRLGSQDKPAILITAGAHGNEVAGVYASLEFLEKFAQEYLRHFCFYVYPCLNPHGFDLGVRWNTADSETRQDANRSCVHGTTVPECAAFIEALRDGPIHYVMTFDLHETPENDAEIMAEQYQSRATTGYEETPRDFYFWETCKKQGSRIGNAIIERLTPDVSLCTWDEIFGDTNSGGVIYYPEGCKNPDYLEGPIDSYLHGRYSDHCFTAETYGGWSLQRRIDVHTLFVRRALDCYLPQ